MDREHFKLHQRIGKCFFVELSEKVLSEKRYAFFRCDCGQFFEARIVEVKKERTKSCGCGIHTPIQLKYGADWGLGTPEYASWSGMKDRCYNPKSNGYHRYGGRGIKVSPKWRNDYEAYLKYMGPRPSEFHSIDRIDVNGNYEPGNCRWATRKEQNRNTRSNVFITIDGKTQCMKDWADTFNVSYRATLNRKRRGWPQDKWFIPITLKTGKKRKIGKQNLTGKIVATFNSVVEAAKESKLMAASIYKAALLDKIYSGHRWTYLS